MKTEKYPRFLRILAPFCALLLCAFVSNERAQERFKSWFAQIEIEPIEMRAMEASFQEEPVENRLKLSPLYRIQALASIYASTGREFELLAEKASHVAQRLEISEQEGSEFNVEKALAELFELTQGLSFQDYDQDRAFILGELISQIEAIDERGFQVEDYDEDEIRLLRDRIEDLILKLQAVDGLISLWDEEPTLCPIGSDYAELIEYISNWSPIPEHPYSQIPLTSKIEKEKRTCSVTRCLTYILTHLFTRLDTFVRLQQEVPKEKLEEILETIQGTDVLKHLKTQIQSCNKN